ncbi:carboxymuconolactone decarboxylase family protein [Asticcacaulis sp. EMRT-3]|uniref:carboxymuconolactone decarboxylase family protein n=1 Tax=Asticcacaulis sp. EMRT-3 TaxID=3040349 RepID=UPI0024AF59AD|nr:carboxymuconolactone decarboxylase family protein [Asticcacaulis sp. EMRT-3]MDI7775576.1 carboxymuconolactone decarboxylase family protein [Asticcacaulis sp. EMRT-3]
MSLDTLCALIPPYAADLAQNLTVLAAETTLDDQQKWGTFLATAHAIGVMPVVHHLEAQAATLLSPEAVIAARAAAAIMGMNNVYYRSLHLLHNKAYEGLPSKLRMNILRNPGVSKIDFELWSLAVSAVNGCGLCLDSHEKVLREHEVSLIQIQTALRIASVVNAISAVLRAEASLAPLSIPATKSISATQNKNILSTNKIK